MRAVKHLFFALRQRLAGGSRISLRSYIKGHERIRMGRKCKIHDAASIDATRGKGVVFGDAVTLNRYAYVQGGQEGVVLGSNVEVNNFSIINGSGGVEIGSDVLIGPGARIISYQHQFAAGTPIRRQPTLGRPIRIHDDVWIGANAIILAGVSIGRGAVIGAGAVVTRDVPPGAVAAGVPARVLRTREPAPPMPAETAQARPDFQSVGNKPGHGTFR